MSTHSGSLSREAVFIAVQLIARDSTTLRADAPFLTLTVSGRCSCLNAHHMVHYSELCSAAGIPLNAVEFLLWKRLDTVRNVTVGVFGISHDSIYDDGQLTPFERRDLLVLRR